MRQIKDPMFYVCSLSPPGRFTRDSQEQEAVCEAHHRLEQCEKQVSCADSVKPSCVPKDAITQMHYVYFCVRFQEPS